MKDARGADGRRRIDRWSEVSWIVSGFNRNRKSTVNPPWLICVDESMVAWTGQGCPNLSFVPRKPGPLDIEVKNACDGCSGVMLHLEIQDNKVHACMHLHKNVYDLCLLVQEMMARKKYRDRYSASVATTLRLVKFANEKRVTKEDRVDRVVVADSWFTSVSTAEALWGEFAIKFIGNVKTATRKFPVEDMRWMLHQGGRGDICVYTSDSGDLFGVGWHVHHYKTFVANAGSTQWATPAKKKRQRDDGSNYWREVPRPGVCEIYYSANGKIDQNNRTRQYLLKLEKTWATNR